MLFDRLYRIRVFAVCNRNLSFSRSGMIKRIGQITGKLSQEELAQVIEGLNEIIA
jgi:hypothetical protein